MKVILIFLLMITALIAKDYVYGFEEGGKPISRVEVKSGVVEIYSNIHKKKFTTKMLYNIHEKHYADSIDYDDYEQKMKSRYPKLEFKVKDVFRWIEYNKYLYIEDLREFNRGSKSL